MLRVDGGYLEGGGQIIRTSLALATILNREVEVFDIRKNRKNPGLAEQHLRVISAFKEIFGAGCLGDYLGSERIEFYPSQKLIREEVKIEPQTSASIGLILQAILPCIYFLEKRLKLQLNGGTAGKWAPPFDFYPYVVFPVLNIPVEVEVLKRGYYPKGGAQVTLSFGDFTKKKIDLTQKVGLEKIRLMSFASQGLSKRRVCQRQVDTALKILKERIKGRIAWEIETAYFETLSAGAELNLCAYYANGVRLWADALGEPRKSAEVVAQEAAEKLLVEIESPSCCDVHLADNLIPYLAFLGGRLLTSQISMHTLTNLWVCEKFLGNIFRREGNLIFRE